MILETTRMCSPLWCSGKALDSKSEGSEFKTRPLQNEDNILEQDVNMIVPLSTQEYKWVPGQ